MAWLRGGSSLPPGNSKHWQPPWVLLGDCGKGLSSLPALFVFAVTLLISMGLIKSCAGSAFLSPPHPALTRIEVVERMREFNRFLKQTGMFHELSSRIWNNRSVVILVPSNDYMIRNAALLSFLKDPRHRSIVRHVIFYHVLLMENGPTLANLTRPINYLPTLANSSMKVQLWPEGLTFGEVVIATSRPNQSLTNSVVRIGGMMLPLEAFAALPPQSLQVLNVSAINDVRETLQKRDSDRLLWSLPRNVSVGDAAIRTLASRRAPGFGLFLSALVRAGLDQELRKFEGALTILVPTEGAFEVAAPGALVIAVRRHMLPMYATLFDFAAANRTLAVATLHGNGSRVFIGAEAPVMSVTVPGSNVTGNLAPQWFQQSQENYWMPLSIIGISSILLGPESGVPPPSPPGLLLDTGAVSPVLAAIGGEGGLFAEFVRSLSSNRTTIGDLVPRLSNCTIVVPPDTSFLEFSATVDPKRSAWVQLLLAHILQGYHPHGNLSGGTVAIMTGDELPVRWDERGLWLGQALIHQQLFLDGSISVLASSGFTVASRALSLSLPVPEFVEEVLQNATIEAARRNLPGYGKVLEVFPRISDILLAVNPVGVELTFLVPDDSAFKSLPPELLQKMNESDVAAQEAIGYHIIQGYYTVGLLRSLVPCTVQLLRSGAFNVSIDEGTDLLSFNKSTHAVRTMAKGNGVVYMLGIDRLLIPEVELLGEWRNPASARKDNSQGTLFIIGLGLILGISMAICVGCGVCIVFRRHRQKIDSSLEEQIEMDRSRNNTVKYHPRPRRVGLR